ncbi:MAG: hypothetical protein WC374_04720 [Phycisphaerae bacterium]
MNIDDFRTMIASMLREGFDLEVTSQGTELIPIGITYKGRWHGTYMSLEEISQSSNPRAKVRSVISGVVESLGGTLKKEKEDE